MSDADALRLPERVLLTGAPGWLGSRLVEVLAAGLPELPALAPLAPGRLRCLVAPGADDAPLRALGAECCPGDLRDPEAARRLCRDAEGALLIHAAGVIHPRRRTRDFVEVNVNGTRSLLAAAEEAGVGRFALVSSNSPLGVRRAGSPLLDEDAPYRPYMGYGRSKRAAEESVRQAGERGRIETTIVRPPWFYGPHQPARQVRFFSMIRAGRFPLLGDGSQRRSMAYVDNLCQGLLRAGTHPAARGRTYWIADERPYPIAEVADTVESLLEEEFGLPCAHRRLRAPALVGRLAELGDAMLQACGLYQQELHVLGEMDKEIACSIERARRELGYAPRWSLRDGMRESIRFCLARGEEI